ncbi:hypothetical protein [Pandoraea bronchicola]|uniref:Capsule polysaccharide biosynthesis protein n=1 Tax=Pandoraea bronchicola TaxID=2508287 RepID=A0A5E5BT87_9BURK|nr:hypothetical protein [Pandoraea bronchicola]VVE89029.1 hypothetical protein PBR20603_02994 [Pandoraea bronchicola]
MKIRNFLSALLRQRLLLPRTRQLAQQFGTRPLARTSARPVDIVVEMVSDDYYFCLLGNVCSALRQRAELRIEQHVFATIRVGMTHSARALLPALFPLNRLHSAPWREMYDTFCNGLGFHAQSFAPLNDLTDAARSLKAWRAIKRGETLKPLRIDGILVGDLINDTYLRFRPAKTVDTSDTFLWYLLWQTFRGVRRARAYFRREMPALYLTSYSTYIQHGVPARVALDEGIAVHAFGNLQEFTKRLHRHDIVHTRNPDDYRERYYAQPDPSEGRAAAERNLSLRLSGGVDTATAYMAKSAYQDTGAAVPDVRGAAVVFLHDFFDSPHIYRNMVFPDFWQWACFTIDTLTESGIPFFVKPHPNQVGPSALVLRELRERYPSLQLIPTAVTNRQLADAGIACAITVYGTIGHEMAYLGVPSIACAHHPHVAFDICKTATSVEEYASLLRRALTLPVDPVLLREQALQFYYSHNLAQPPEALALRDAMVRAWKLSHDHEVSAQELQDAFRTMRELPGFTAVIDEFLAIVQHRGNRAAVSTKTTGEPNESASRIL